MDGWYCFWWFFLSVCFQQESEDDLTDLYHNKIKELEEKVQQEIVVHSFREFCPEKTLVTEH